MWSIIPRQCRALQRIYRPGTTVLWEQLRQQPRACQQTLATQDTRERSGAQTPPRVEDARGPSLRWMEEGTYAQTRPALDEALSLPPEVYWCPDYYEAERARVFAKSWVCVGYTQQLQRPGDTFPATVAGQPVLVTRTKHGDLRGFYNVCRHRGSQIVTKEGRYPVLVCPYHRWGYAPDGRLIATPMINTKGADSAALCKALDTSRMKNFDRKDYGLFPVHVDTVGNLVFVSLDRHPPPLRAVLGDAVEQLAPYRTAALVRVRSKVYSGINANWKLLVENFNEYLHLPAVHPQLCAVSGVDEHVRMQGTGMYVGFGTKPLSRGGTPLDPGFIPDLPGLPEHNRDMALFHALWPNVFYFALPSHVFTVYCTPRGPGMTDEHADLFVDPSVLQDPDAQAKIDAIWAFYDEVNMQDISACELVQVGVRSGPYRGGRMVFRFEETIHRYANILIDHMIGKPRIPLGDDRHMPGTAWDDSVPVGTYAA